MAIFNSYFDITRGYICFFVDGSWRCTGALCGTPHGGALHLSRQRVSGLDEPSMKTCRKTSVLGYVLGCLGYQGFDFDIQIFLSYDIQICRF